MPGKHNAGGCKCCIDSCGCRTGTNPDTWTVVISGIVDGAADPPEVPVCENCDRFNGTFVLSRVTGKSCEWEYVFDDCVCCCYGSSRFDRISLAVTRNPTTGCFNIGVTIRIVTAYHQCYLGCKYRWDPFTLRYVLHQKLCDLTCYGCPDTAGIPYSTEYIWLNCVIEEGDDCNELNDGITPGNTCGFSDTICNGNDCDLADEELTVIDNTCYGICDFSAATCFVTAG